MRRVVHLIALARAAAPSTPQPLAGVRHAFPNLFLPRRSFLTGGAPEVVGTVSAAAAAASRCAAYFSRFRYLGYSSLQRNAGFLPRSLVRHIRTPESAVWLLIGANAAVFVLWRIASPSFMRRHFMLSLENFENWRVHTLLTSAFSHIELMHMASNMIGLYFFGNSIASIFGPSFLLKLYVAGAIGGSIFFLVHKAMLAASRETAFGWHVSRAPAVGASAAVNAIILLEVFLYPTRMVHLYFFIPVPAAVLGALLIGSDLWNIRQGTGRVDGSAHLGGAFVATVAYAMITLGLIS